jgi:1-aminocyclopropane-1-carboxylate deaminase
VTLQDFPRYPLTFGPSPVHRLDRLTTHLGGATVWAKREDCNSGLAFGGNEIRKLEYVVPDALAKGADTLVNDRVGNILLSRIMGADVRLDPAGFDIGIRSSWEEALREVEEAGGIPYGIPAGASEHPLGGLGFANWAFEVAEQEQQLGVFFDTIIVCTVTGSTHAGMIAGFAALDQQTKGRPRRVLGIDASATIEKTRDQVARIARNTGKLIELGRDLTDEEIIVLEGWAGDFYGIPVESTIEAIKLSGSLEGMIIDPVYEGKSMAGLIDLVSSGEIPKGSTVLYAHLGGQPALNAYAGIF